MCIRDRPSFVPLFPAAADAFGLYRVTINTNPPHTGGVKQVQPHAAQLHGLLDNIPGRACHRRDDGPVEPGKQVQPVSYTHLDRFYPIHFLLLVHVLR